MILFQQRMLGALYVTRQPEPGYYSLTDGHSYDDHAA
jgi:hypothetical protein